MSERDRLLAEYHAIAVAVDTPAAVWDFGDVVVKLRALRKRSARVVSPDVWEPIPWPAGTPQPRMGYTWRAIRWAGPGKLEGVRLRPVEVGDE